MKLRNKFITQRQRHNDCHLLDDVLTHTSPFLSRKKLLACRLYLQITLLSDIPNIKGTTLLPNILIGTRNTNTHHTSSWPLQKSITITLGNFGTELCEVYTVAQHLPFNWCIDISTRLPLIKFLNTNILHFIAVLSKNKVQHH